MYEFEYAITFDFFGKQNRYSRIWIVPVLLFII